MAKLIASIAPEMYENSDLRKRIADTLGVLPEDILWVPAGVSVFVVDVPGDLVKAREKADAQAKHDAEKKAKEEQDKKDMAAKAAAQPAKATHKAHA